MNIGDRIKNRRLELGLTQEEVAKKAGYKSRSSINKIELSRDLPLTKVKEVARILDCTPSYLLGWEDKEQLIETAKTDVMLSNMEDKLKQYALKMAKLPKEKQDLALKMIDELGK